MTEPFSTRRLQLGNCYACAGDNWIVNQGTVGCATCHPPVARASDAQVALIRQYAAQLDYASVTLGGFAGIVVAGEAGWQFWTSRMSRVGATWLLEKLARGGW